MKIRSRSRREVNLDAVRFERVLHACQALAPGGKLAQMVDEDISELASDTLRRLHRGDLAIDDQDEEALLAHFWWAITRTLFPRSSGWQPFCPLLYRRRGGEKFEVASLTSVDAFEWPAVGNA